MSETQQQMVFRQLKNGHRRNKYTQELRCFALTLNLYSPSAYEYVRTVFGKNALPHQRTLSKWYSSVDGTLVYSAEPLRAIQVRVEIESKKWK